MPTSHHNMSTPTKLSAPSKILCIGDSLIAGFPYDVDESWVAECGRMTGIEMINRGICGECCADIVDRLKGQLVATHARHVLLEGGMNDILDYVPMDATMDELRRAITISHDNGAKIAIVMPWRVAAYELNDKIDELRECMTRELIGTPLIDMEPCLPPLGDRNNCFVWDGVHPTDATYKLIGNYATKIITKETLIN